MSCFLSSAASSVRKPSGLRPLLRCFLSAAASSSAAAVGPSAIYAAFSDLRRRSPQVIATIGKKITELTPTRGFAAEFAAASVVLVASKLGLPISATHTLVGAVMGVGFARGLNSVRAETVREIVASWAVTIPVGAFLSVCYTAIITRLLSFSL